MQARIAFFALMHLILVDRAIGMWTLFLSHDLRKALPHCWQLQSLAYRVFRNRGSGMIDGMRDVIFAVD
jgi:hypothetical protein